MGVFTEVEWNWCSIMGPMHLQDGSKCITVPYFSNKNVKIKMPNDKLEHFGSKMENMIQWIRWEPCTNMYFKN